jgi:hypothetical protein
VVATRSVSGRFAPVKQALACRGGSLGMEDVVSRWAASFALGSDRAAAKRHPPPLIQGGRGDDPTEDRSLICRRSGNCRFCCTHATSIRRCLWCLEKPETVARHRWID